MVAGRNLALSDPGGVRAITARWTLTGRLTLETATHLGAGPSDSTDMSVIRDTLSGAPMLLGASLAGALRAHLTDVLGGYRCEGKGTRADRLFGGERGDDQGTQSPLIVFDALGTLPPNGAIEIRDGVQIDEATGTAEDHKKFDYEVLPAGTSFSLRFDLLVSSPACEDELVSLLLAALRGLAPGEISLGARRSRGLGAVRTGEWKATRTPLDSREGWLGWLLDEGVLPTPGLQAACEDALGHPLEILQDRRERIVVDLDLTAPLGLLVRGTPEGSDSPDAAHLSSGGAAVLPGTSVAGAMRQQALRIAHVVRAEHRDAARWVERLFGPRLRGATDPAGFDPYASRLRISESIVDAAARSRFTRVGIDRFTQGVVPGALFDEETVSNGSIQMRFEVRDPHPGELGFVLLLLKDVLTGELTFGGTASVGRGGVIGTATLVLGGAPVTLDPQMSGPVDSVVDEAIRGFWTAAVLGEAS